MLVRPLMLSLWVTNLMMPHLQTLLPSKTTLHYMVHASARAFSSKVQPTLKFPTLFSTYFGPSVLLSASPSLFILMNYDKGVTNSSISHSLTLQVFHDKTFLKNRRKRYSLIYNFIKQKKTNIIQNHFCLFFQDMI